MLSDMEAAIVFVEKQDLEGVSKVKDAWQMALGEASRVLSWSDKLLVEYNPGIWRVSRHPVGIRMVSAPWGKFFIFEFASPNLVLPFDCFDSGEAKTGVMVHEVAHLIDDRRWGFDLRSLAVESLEYVTREQRAELLAFAGYPLGIFEANRALIGATAKKLGIELGEYLWPLAAVETLGRIGVCRSDDLVGFYGDIEYSGVPVHRVLEEYLATNVFSLAGLTTGPDLNNSNAYGIKRSKDLASARALLCGYLKGKMDRMELEGKLAKLNYKVGDSSEGYNPLSCIDFKHLNLEASKKNISLAREAFRDISPWKCFDDLRKALEDVETWIKFKNHVNYC